LQKKAKLRRTARNVPLFCQSVKRRRDSYFYSRYNFYFLQLNDVQAGGRTVFPRIGAGVVPVKGSAVFWYNLFESGDPDKLTLHGACPVLYGTKWGKLNFYLFMSHLSDIILISQEEEVFFLKICFSDLEDLEVLV